MPPWSSARVSSTFTEGVRRVSLATYCHMHTRICRPVGLSAREIRQVIDFMERRIGYRYDLKNIVDLARYLIQTPPVPRKHRRRLLALGSGDPTRAICSSLIAQAFQTVNYPILPEVESSSVIPDRNLPAHSAVRMMFRAARSLTDPLGLNHSALP